MLRRLTVPCVAFVAGFALAAVVSCAAFDRSSRDAAALPQVTADHAVAVPSEIAGAVAKASSGNVVGAIADLGTVVATVNEVAQTKGDDGKPLGYGGAAAAILALLLGRFRSILPEWLSGPSAMRRRQKPTAPPPPVN